MVCLLAQSARYISPSRYLDIFIHSMHWVSKKNTKLTRNLPVRPTIPSILPFNRKPASTAETSPMSDPLQWPVASATPCRISGVKIHLLGFTAGGGNEFRYTQEMMQRTLVGPKKYHMFGSWKIGRSIFYSFSGPKDIKRSVPFPFSKGEKTGGQNSPPRLWHLQVETQGVGQTPAARPSQKQPKYSMLNLECKLIAQLPR